MINQIMTAEQIILLNSKIENVLDSLCADQMVNIVHCFADCFGKLKELGDEKVQILLLSYALALESNYTGVLSLQMYRHLLRDEADIKNKVSF